MTVLHAASHTATAQAEPLSVDAAYERSRRAALVESQIGPVGLEIESHLVDFDSVGESVPWDRVSPMLEVLDAAPRKSKVSLEPGGQLELSGLPEPAIETAIDQLRHDMMGTRLALAELRLGMAYAGADPVRPSRRVNPRSRYEAMEQHFAATGRGTHGAVMMNSTAAMQLNLQAGPQGMWAERVARAYRLGPTLVAISASSPWLHGRDTGWKSARQRAWSGLDPRSCGPVPGCVAPDAATAHKLDPASAWARYALAAPVTFVRTRGDQALAVRTPVPFERWASGAIRLGGRLPTAADLDVHLTTLFPPVRLRGYLELRYLDMTAPRWWPAIAAVATTLMDDPVAADQMTEAAERTAPLWTAAAREGLSNTVLAESARRAVAIAAERVPAGLGSAVFDLAELIDSGCSPGDLLAQRIAEIGPSAAFEELAHA
ncbi:MAG TPA: glutamate-cysteine ligase family protein [Streptosporangiaceae bacterium]|nr:glutamate-cysteine ligase family protein [Streptosporangiaceae bacterium]